jgi:hypothetical protein
MAGNTIMPPRGLTIASIDDVPFTFATAVSIVPSASVYYYEKNT